MERIASAIFGSKGCLERAVRGAMPLVLLGILAYAGINALIKSSSAQTSPEPPTIVNPSPTELPTPESTLTQSNDCTIKQPGQTTWGAATSLGEDPNIISDFSAYTVTYPDKQQFTLDLDSWSTTDTGSNATGVRQAPVGSIICIKK